MPIDLYNIVIWSAVGSAFCTVYLMILALSKHEESLEEKLQRFTALRIPNNPTTGKKDIKVLLSRLAGFTPKRWRGKIDRELMRGDIQLKGGEFLVLQGFLSLIFYLAGIFIVKNILLSLLFLFTGGLIPQFWLRSAQKRKRKQFNNQLADSLLILANSLRAGFSLLQAMEMVSQEMPNPISGEFKLTLKEMTYGTPTETALLHLGERVDSDDLNLLVTAVLIQRQVGGNLAEVLMNIHATIQDRIRIHQEIKTLTAQGRMSGYIIAALPFGIAAVLTVLNPSYLKVLITHPLGLIMIGAGLVSELIGFIIIRKIITIEA
jgi:tight adherence protein B